MVWGSRARRRPAPWTCPHRPSPKAYSKRKIILLFTSIMGAYYWRSSNCRLDHEDRTLHLWRGTKPRLRARSVHLAVACHDVFKAHLSPLSGGDTRRSIIVSGRYKSRLRRDRNNTVPWWSTECCNVATYSAMTIDRFCTWRDYPSCIPICRCTTWEMDITDRAWRRRLWTSSEQASPCLK